MSYEFGDPRMAKMEEYGGIGKKTQLEYVVFSNFKLCPVIECWVSKP